jgi:hypothetical protein
MALLGQKLSFAKQEKYGKVNEDTGSFANANAFARWKGGKSGNRDYIMGVERARQKEVFDINEEALIEKENAEYAAEKRNRPQYTPLMARRGGKIIPRYGGGGAAAGAMAGAAGKSGGAID